MATRINLKDLAATYGSATTEQQNAVNASGGLLILEQPRDYSYLRNANLYRCTRAYFKTAGYPNPHGYHETAISSGVTIYTDEGETGTMSLDIRDAAGKSIVTLSADFIRGICSIDTGSVLRTMAAKHFSETASVDEQPACSLTYQSRGFNVADTFVSFHTLNGVAQIGQRQYAESGVSEFLEDLPTAHIFIGYPWTYVQKAGQAAAATPYEGVTIPAGEIREVRIQTANASSVMSDLQTVGIGYAQVHTEICENPFYVRWLNRKGGISYWMFSKRQIWAYKAGNTLLRDVLVYDVASAKSNVEEYGKEAQIAVTFGAGNLTEQEAAALRRLALSPIVEYWDGSRWTAITLDSYDEQADKGNGCNDIEFTYNLPRVLI